MGFLFIPLLLNPIALRTAKTLLSFGHSDRVLAILSATGLMHKVLLSLTRIAAPINIR